MSTKNLAVIKQNKKQVEQIRQEKELKEGEQKKEKELGDTKEKVPQVKKVG